MCCLRTFVLLFLTRISHDVYISFQMRKIYMVCTRIKYQSAVQLTWRDIIRAILFLDTRENGCICDEMFLMIFARVHTCARKVMRINVLLSHALAISCSPLSMRWSCEQGRAETLQCHVIYVDISHLYHLKKNKDSVERNSEHFFLIYFRENVLICISL